VLEPQHKSRYCEKSYNLKNRIDIIVKNGTASAPKEILWNMVQPQHTSRYCEKSYSLKNRIDIVKNGTASAPK